MKNKHLKLWYTLCLVLRGASACAEIRRERATGRCRTPSEGAITTGGKMEKKYRAACFVSALMLATSASLADGSPVTLAGGFTSFSGTVGTGQFVTKFYEGDTNNGGEVTKQYVVCPSAGCNGAATVGLASVLFSSPVSILSFGATQFGVPLNANLVGFIPNTTPQDAVVGQEILLGTLLFTNGTWFGDADFGFNLTIVSNDSALDGKTFSDTLHMSLTPNDFANHTPQENADFVYFANNTVLGSIRAYELQDTVDPCEVFKSPLVPGLTVCGNQASAQLFGVIHSLDPTRFELDPATGGFFDAGVSLNPTIPEPGTLALVLLGLLGLLLTRRNSQ